MIFIDTNYLIRFFTNDIKDQAKLAKEVIEKQKVYITGIVLAESVYILESHYKASKFDLTTKLISLLRQENVAGASYLILSLEIYQKESISYYDCLLASEVLKGKGELMTFDKKLQKVIKKYS